MTLAEFVEDLRKDFKFRMDQKTGWGKNDVMTEFEAALLRAVLKASKVG